MKLQEPIHLEGKTTMIKATLQY